MRTGALLMVAFTALTTPAQRAQEHYDLAHPDRRFALPAELREISALTDINAQTVAALQDEMGRIYFIDHTTGRVTATFDFAAAGDYEGLTRVGSDLYTLRSDGLIHHLVVKDGKVTVADTIRVDVPNRNLESIGYDEERHLLLIAAKDNLKGSPSARDRRYVYGWDLRRRQLLDRPVLDMSVAAIIAEAQAMGVKLPRERKKNGKEEVQFKLRPSSIALQPQQGTYWLLSAADHTLLIFDRSGHLLDLVPLDRKLYPKAEGITFLANGDLLISNEGKDAPANLLFFRRK